MSPPEKKRAPRTEGASSSKPAKQADSAKSTDRTGELVAVAPGGVEWRIVPTDTSVAAACYLDGCRVRHQDGEWWVEGCNGDRRDLTDVEVLLLWHSGPACAYVDELAPLYASIPPFIDDPATVAPPRLIYVGIDDTDRIRDLVDRLPDFGVLVGAAAHSAMDHTSDACDHIEDGEPAHLCAHHARLVLCDACMWDHLLHHEVDHTLRCSNCEGGAAVTEAHVALPPYEFLMLRPSRRVTVSLYAWGLALCHRCEAELPVFVGTGA